MINLYRYLSSINFLNMSKRYLLNWYQHLYKIYRRPLYKDKIKYLKSCGFYDQLI